MSRARDKPPDGTHRVAVFDSPAEFFSALRRAPQHDAHVACWRGES